MKICAVGAELFQADMDRRNEAKSLFAILRKCLKNLLPEGLLACGEDR